MSGGLLNEGQGRVRVVGRLDFATLPELLAASRRIFADHSGAPLVMQFDPTEGGNSAGLALLLTWREWAQAARIALRFEGLSESIRELARLSNVEPWLDSPPRRA